jgi:hypothetical protein
MAMYTYLNEWRYDSTLAVSMELRADTVIPGTCCSDVGFLEKIAVNMAGKLEAGRPASRTAAVMCLEA